MPIFLLTLIIATLVVLTWIDIKHHRLPDILTLPLIAGGLAWAFWSGTIPLMDSLLGAMIGFLSLYLLGEAFFRLRKIDGLGLGDAKLFAGVGAWLGWQALPYVALLAAIISIVWHLTIRISRKDASPEQPFGPALAIAFITGLLGWLPI